MGFSSPQVGRTRPALLSVLPLLTVFSLCSFGSPQESERASQNANLSPGLQAVARFVAKRGDGLSASDLTAATRGRGASRLKLPGKAPASELTEEERLALEAHGHAENPHGYVHEVPHIEIDPQTGTLRVETEDGPVFIRQCVRPEGDTAGGGGPLGSHGGLRTTPLTGAAGASGVPGGGGTSAPTVGGSSTGAGAHTGIGFGGIYPSCLVCHQGVENMTEIMGFDLDCTFCHGGDPFGISKAQSHVFSDGTVNYDETTPSLTDDLAFQKWLNPTNLRVVDTTCGLCHVQIASNIKKSMMATAAGHYVGGFFLGDVVATKTPEHGTFAVQDLDGTVPGGEGAVASLQDLIFFDPSADPTKYSTHFQAVPSQQCARCHLWTRGRGYRGATGEDGVYRADGCAACHLLYANDGLSQSADQTIDHTEPGHPMRHGVTRQIPTQQCVHCHHRGARIGLNFTGRAQMPPRLPSGPGVPGTTDEIFNRNYHYTVADTNPPDIHFERGMHCIDCHVASEIMGDGNIWGHMDQATKIECRTCHGLPGIPPSLKDNDGVHLPNVDQDLATGDYILTSKVNFAEHLIKTVDDVITPSSPYYNPLAAACMNSDHLKDVGGLECYACHSAWVPNCFGCHFERDERELGLNLISGQMEVGKVTTSNKIFESMRHFSFGPNSEGRIAPYLVGCHPIADVTAPDGTKILDMVMPVTRNGLSGLAHNPVQPHTVRGGGNVRTCAECHRSPASLGFGTGNYAIARDRLYMTGGSGVELFDRKSNPGAPATDGSLAIPAGAVALASMPNGIEGTADYLFVAEGMNGLSIFDRTPGGGPGAVHTITGIDAIDVSRAARYLYVIENGVGLRIYDNDVPTTTTLVSSVSIPNAKRAVPFGIHLFVPAGATGLVIVNIADHNAPYIEATVGGINADDVELYSHYQGGADFAVRAYVADATYGVHVVNLLPSFATAQLMPGNGIALVGAAGLDCYTRWVSATAIEPSREHDYLYVAAGSAGLHVFDITSPDGIVQVGTVALAGNATDVSIASQLAPPGVDDYGYVSNATLGLQVIYLNDPTSPLLLNTVAAMVGAERIFTEIQAMDRYLDEQGNTLKENSHPYTGTFTRADIVRLLSVTIP